MRVVSKVISVITNLLSLEFPIRQVLVFLPIEVRTVRGVHNTLISILAFVLLYLCRTIGEILQAMYTSYSLVNSDNIQAEF